MKKKTIFLALLMLIPACVAAQNWNDKKYLQGAVPVNEQGVVYFRQTCYPNDRNRAEMYAALKAWLTNSIVGGENAVAGQCRIVEDNEEEGLLAARVNEYLYFKRTAWAVHRTQFLYDIIINVEDGGYTIELQHLRYLYAAQESEGTEPERRSAEEWITDAEALNSKGKLLRKTRQFRVFTIDRKDEIFDGAWKAVVE